MTKRKVSVKEKKIIMSSVLILIGLFLLSLALYIDNRRLANTREEARCVEKYFDYRNGFIKRDRVGQNCLDSCLLIWKTYENSSSGEVKCKWDFGWTYSEHFNYWFYRLKNLGSVKGIIYERL